VDAEPLAALRPLERRDAVVGRLAEDRRRLQSEPRPRAVVCFTSATVEGACVVLPLEPGDVGNGDRRQRLAATAAAALSGAAGLGYPEGGADLQLEPARWNGYLALRVAVPEGGTVAELFELELEEQAASLDRIQPVAVTLPGGTLDETEPAATAEWLWRAELAARLGGRPGAARLDEPTSQALALFVPSRPPLGGDGEQAAAHDDPMPRRKIVRRILRRLDGMGKYNGYHTEFSHLARGFPGHERSLALEAGEALLRAGLLEQKPSVGQRHVYLVAAQTAEIHRIIETGETRSPELRAFYQG
jgi:hypothetical protein